MQKLIQLINRLPVVAGGRTCPLCGSTFNRYLPLHPKYTKAWRQHGFPFGTADFETLHAEAFSCPVCYGSDRDRLMAHYLKTQRVFDASEKDLLDIAPSAGFAQWLKRQPGVQYLSCDLMMEGVDVQADLQNLHMFTDDRFDVIICSHVLEHVPNDRKAMRELYRVLKPGGVALLLVPLVARGLAAIEEDPGEEDVARRWRRFGQDDHIRLYNSEGFASRLVESGFRLERYTPNDTADALKSMGIHPGSVLYIGKK